jgi:hypothetical protein
MSSADEFLYKESVDPTENEVVATDKRVYQILDQNGGAYNGQILFDTSTLANSGQWLGYSEAYLQIPFVVSFKSSTDITAANASVKAFGVALKNGYYQLIDSIQIEYNNTTVVQQQPFCNIHTNYKLLSSFSLDDSKKWGSTLNFAPDTATTFSYAAAANASGDGHSNNRVSNGAIDFVNNNLSYQNTGLLSRMANTGYLTGYGGITNLNTYPLLNQIGKNYQNNNGGAAAARVFNYSIIATVRLKDLTDYFDKLPLVRGASMRITIVYNSCEGTYTSVAAGPTMVTTSYTQKSGNCNPFILASSAANEPNNGPVVNGGGGVFNVSCGVSSAIGANFAAQQNGIFTQCRLYVPAYTLNPLVEKNLITVSPIREVKYLDVYNYQMKSIAAGSSFNTILTNGIVNPKYLVMVGQLNGLVANTGLAINIAPYQSPFDTSPSTSCPFAAIGQFQVQVAGQNMFQQNFQYDYEDFINEVSAMYAINGGLSSGINAGLISHSDWDNAYRYYVCDLSRRVPSEDGVAKSVVVQGVNNTAKVMDYICFIAFERMVKIDMRTGLLV